MFNCQKSTTYLAAAYWSPDAVFLIWRVHNDVAKRVNHVDGVVHMDGTLTVGRGCDRDRMTSGEKSILINK